MAIRKISGHFYAYFRSLETETDGTVRPVTRTVRLYAETLLEAKALESEIMRKNRELVQHIRAKIIMERFEIGTEDVPHPVLAPARKRKKRLLMTEALETAKKYRSVGHTSESRWKAFCYWAGVKYMDEVTEEMAFRYLNEKGGNGENGKNFNNIKSCLNAVFKTLLLDAGMEASPFAKIPNRVVKAQHQRPFTEEEFRRIYEAAEEPWKSACVIAWFTGLREKDVFVLRWDQIAAGVITTTPAKTSRFGRAVRIPLHPQLESYLATIPRAGARVLGAWPYEPQDWNFNGGFGVLLRKLKIKDTPEGRVCFNSIRNSFVSRCDAAGVPRHAIRGIVGHASERMTDLYSHDLTTAKMITTLDWVDLGKKK